jgi:RNA recognition motif-containing protein
MTKLFVGNLPFSASESDIRALFEQHGNVESFAMINDRETGRPRGFGFIEMSSGDATKAMQALNGHMLDGRALKVNEAQAKTDAPRRANRY